MRTVVQRKQGPEEASSLQTDRAQTLLAPFRQTGPRLSELPSDRAQAGLAPFRQMGLTDFCPLAWLLLGAEACPIHSFIHLSIPLGRAFSALVPVVGVGSTAGV